MNFFGGNSNNGPTPLTIAKMEAEVLTDLFNRITQNCSKKCVAQFNENDLNVGEMACVDRCVSKYLQTHEKVGEVLNNFEKQLLEQEKGGKSQPKFANKL